MYIVPSYLLYLAISLGVTIWVAGTLHKNGRGRGQEYLDPPPLPPDAQIPDLR
jgi:hypothetical protein